MKHGFGDIAIRKHSESLNYLFQRVREGAHEVFLADFQHVVGGKGILHVEDLRIVKTAQDESSTV
jgi:hypothetical protein